MATITLIPGQKVTLSAVTTKANVDGPVVGLPAWTSNSATLVSLTPSADGRNCLVTSKGGIGSCTVTCTAAGGAGAITDNVTITIVAATTPIATALKITAQGPPV